MLSLDFSFFYFVILRIYLFLGLALASQVNTSVKPGLWDKTLYLLLGLKYIFCDFCKQNIPEILTVLQSKFNNNLFSKQKAYCKFNKHYIRYFKVDVGTNGH